MFRDRTTRILLLILLVFMLVVSGVAVSGRMTHDPPNGLRCFVGPVKWHGPPPGSVLFEYYSRDCTRSIAPNGV